MSSLTVKDAVFSVLKGDSPTNSFPFFFKLTDLETTVETFKRVFISSRRLDEKQVRVQVNVFTDERHARGAWDLNDS